MDDQSAQGSLGQPGGPHAPDASPAEAAQAYRVLARKYRPRTFAELIGQDALVRTLSNALASGRLAHAFVLTGVRGVGKTTTARIIARALNCTGPDGTGGPTIEPCGVCENCVAIGQDRHVDVLEMDAASRTGIGDVRELIEGVRYRPVSARYKVYIIDEVHMLSTQAFNGLLKTLEEPPEHVKFIFATTEIRKVPVTVLSRCQRFDLRRVDSEVLMHHFDRVARAEGAVLEPEALALVARAADGSVRDGLSILDQAIAHAGTAPVNAGTVREMLGLADRSLVIDLAEALLRGEVRGALGLFAEMHATGADAVAVIQDLLELTHWLTRIRVAPDEADDVTVPEAERVRGRAMATQLGMPVLTRLWQMLLKGLGEVQHAPSPRLAAEMLLVRIAYAATLPTPAELVARIEADGPDTASAGSAASSAGAAAGAVSPAEVARPVAAARPLPPQVEPPQVERLQVERPQVGRPAQESPTGTTSASAPGIAVRSPGGGPAAPRAALAPRPEPDLMPPDGEAATAALRSVPPQVGSVQAGAAQAEMPAATQGTDQPRSFAEVADLFARRGEMLLHANLWRNVHPVDFRPGRLEIRPSAQAPQNLAGLVAAKLSDWTGTRWVVSVSGEAGAPTLAEEEAARLERARQEAAEHPLVQAVLSAFPGATIAAVRRREAVAAPAQDPAPPAAVLDDDLAELDFSDAMDEDDT